MVVTASGNPKHGFDVFRHSPEAQDGEACPAPAFAPGGTGDFRISARAVKAHDSAIADVHSESLIGTNEGVSPQPDDQVLMHVVRRHSWSFTRRRDRQLTVPAGQFMLQRSGPPMFEVAPRATATVLILPRRHWDRRPRSG